MTFGGWGPFDVDWSSTGRLVFTATEPGRPSCSAVDIYAMNVNGSNLRNITPGGCPSREPHDPTPDWSPDGRRIAYARDNEIWVMAASGRSPLRLTDNGGLKVRPVWSPDGRRIAFARLGSRGSEIVVMNADGTRMRRLTDGGSPAWQPGAAN
jgi:Tol biopolymer transport system component